MEDPDMSRLVWSRQWLGRKGAPACVDVAAMGQGKGLGLRCGANGVACGARVEPPGVSGAPLVCLQDTDNRAMVGPACDACMALLHDGVAHPCEHGCGIAYCSPQCRTRDWASSHWALCVGPIDSMEHALVRFKVCAMQADDVFLLCARAAVLAMSHCAAARGAAVAGQGQEEEDEEEEEGGEAQAPTWMGPLAGFVTAPWPDLLPPSVACVVREQGGPLVRLFVDGVTDVVQSHPHVPPALDRQRLLAWLRAFTLERMWLLIGVFSMNQVDVDVPHPVEVQWGQAVARADAEAARQAVERVYQEQQRFGGDSFDDGPEEGEHEGNEQEQRHEEDDDNDDNDDAEEDACSEGFHTNSSEHEACCDEDHCDEEMALVGVRGMALIPIVALLNHSCCPNVDVLYDTNAHAYLRARRDITPHEELTICYADALQPLQERRRELALAYRFHCTCTRCEEEEEEE